MNKEQLSVLAVILLSGGLVMLVLGIGRMITQ